MEKSAEAFRTISEVADFLETPAHVLRFWESRFPQIRPVKRAGGRRYYRPADVALLSGIRRLLHDEGMTIRGVQKILREQGVRHVAGLMEAPQDDAFDAMSADPPEQTGFAFDAPLSLGEVIRPVFGAPPPAEPPEGVDGGGGDDGALPEGDGAGDAHSDWPAAEPPLFDQPFAETGTEDLPHWAEAAPDDSAPGHDDAAPVAATETPHAGEDLWEASASPVDLAEHGEDGESTTDSSDAQQGHPAPVTGISEPDAVDQTEGHAPDGGAEDEVANLWAEDAPEPDVATEPETALRAEPPATVPQREESPAAPDTGAIGLPTAAHGSESAAPRAQGLDPQLPVWLPAVLRALPPGALADQQAALVPLVARLAALRDRMAEAARAGRK
jgi:DNA-binding transcriptional MerR regulator